MLSNKKILFAIIPLILSIGIITALPFADSYQPKADSYPSKDVGIQCREDHVLFFRTTVHNYICVSESNANRLVDLGMGKISDKSKTGESHMGEKPMIAPSSSEIDFKAEQNLLPLADGGTGPLTVTPVIGEPSKEYPEMYVPGTEELAEDEIRLSFCGSGMPFVTYAQASACVIVETGDGKAYLFDIGSGSIGRINAMQIHGNDLTNVFISHTHTDHIGDLGPFWAQAYLSGRAVPIELYGPSGANHELGTEYFVENFLKTYTWDFETRRGLIATSGQAINVHEFDYTKTQVIYDQDNFRVTAFPAIHGIDGAVSFRMDWKDLSVVFSGDTNINEYIIENSHKADVVIMETFSPEEYYMEFFGWPKGMYGDSIAKHHVPAERAALFFAVVEPRLAVSYHQTLDELSTPLIFESIRHYYDEPYVFAQDLTIINITPDYIITRQADIDENSLPVVTEELKVTDERKYFTSEWLEETVLYEDDLKEILEQRDGQ